MGRRRLAYTVRKFNDGFYVLLNVAAPGSLIGEIERRLRVSEPVIKFITVRMDEEEKRLAKVKAIRDTKVKRSAQPIVSQEAPAPVATPAITEPDAVAAEPVAAEPVLPRNPLPLSRSLPLNHFCCPAMWLSARRTRTLAGTRFSTRLRPDIQRLQRESGAGKAQRTT